jgi:hypothetical protein
LPRLFSCDDPVQLITPSLIQFRQSSSLLLLNLELFHPIRASLSILFIHRICSFSIPQQPPPTCLSRAVSTPFPHDDPVNHSAHHWPAAAFPASEAFEAINDALSSDEAERKNAIKQAGSVFAFTLKNKAGETESWNVDLKNKGVVSKGLGDKPTGKRALPLAIYTACNANLPSPPVTLSLSDDDFGKLVAGKANAQRLFMSGKLKVKGDVMKATKLEPILAKSRTKAKL